MPRAVNRVVGFTPNTGCSTVATASTHTTTRRIFTKIEAFGTCERSRILRTTRVSALSMMMAISTTMARNTSFP